jgi:hypothetical protein
MSEFTINELKYEIAEILSEAKKKKEKEKQAMKKEGAVGAYGHYEEAFDFSAPLGAYNLYRQQGAVNWGPMTSDGVRVDSNFSNPANVSGLKESEERALRTIVREVIQFGLIPGDSAWAPVMQRSAPAAGNIWEAAKHWYEAKACDAEQEVPMGPRAKGHEKTEYGSVKKHGQAKK